LKLRETEVELLPRVSARLGAEVFIKRDDRTDPVYGGNKPRKLTRILAHARTAGADTLVTSGTVGSHHALATTVHGRAMGFDVHVVLAPQQLTEHAETVARATVAQGAIVHCCPALALLPVYVAALQARLRAEGRRVWGIHVGGSDVLGASGYWDAMIELRAQVERGAMGGRWPDLIVCAHGSGGTHAGLLAAQRAHGMSVGVVGVMVAIPWAIPRVRTAWLARGVQRASARAGIERGVGVEDVVLVGDQLGDGYGVRTARGDEATALFAEDGIELDPTYTAKTAAAVVAMTRVRKAQRILYWHTLSSASYAPLVQGCDRLPEPVRALLR
jgi:1-aminocyclopropane-1-carboxylate deaminase/D-cysteine desulfhydrase-like pyridoxal-dependent ACC family enzyme